MVTTRYTFLAKNPPTLLDLLAAQIDEDGSVTITHKPTGSSITFKADGDIEQKAAKSLRQGGNAYHFVNDWVTTDAEVDAMNLARVALGDRTAINELIFQKRVPHLYEEAVVIAQQKGFITSDGQPTDRYFADPRHARQMPGSNWLHALMARLDAVVGHALQRGRTRVRRDGFADSALRSRPRA